MVGNSGAIWIWAGGLTLSRSQTSFQNSISALYSYQSVQPAPGPLCTRRTHGPVLLLLSVHSVCKDAQSRVANIINIRLSDRTCRLWWVTEQNKYGSSLDALSLKDVQLVFPFFFFLYYAYPIILNDRLCRIDLFFSAALFTVLTARC